MVDRETRDSAFDLVSHRMIDVLHDWMINERRNLDGFIAHPEGHAEYNPYLIFDTVALQSRSTMLGQIANGLVIISGHKQGDTNYTRAMHDYALDHIPIIILERLSDWMRKRANDMQKYLDSIQSNGVPVPIPDYGSLISFDSAKYGMELNMYKTSSDAILIVIEFAKQ
jgi:hypothetical protein